MVGLIADVAGADLDAAMQNFLRILAENHRLLLLPEIAAHYEELRSEVENTVDVEVISAVALERRAAAKAQRGAQHAPQAQGAHAKFRRRDAVGRRGGARRRPGDRRLAERPSRTARDGFNRLEPIFKRANEARSKRNDMSIKASEISDLIKARIDKFEVGHRGAQCRHGGDRHRRHRARSRARRRALRRNAGIRRQHLRAGVEPRARLGGCGGARRLQAAFPKVPRSRPRAAFSKCRWVRSFWAAWSMRWESRSTARAR